MKRDANIFVIVVPGLFLPYLLWRVRLSLYTLGRSLFLARLSLSKRSFLSLHRNWKHKKEAICVQPPLCGNYAGGRPINGRVSRQWPEALPPDPVLRGSQAVQTPQHPEFSEPGGSEDPGHLRGTERARSDLQRGPHLTELLQLAKTAQPTQWPGWRTLWHRDSLHQTGRSRTLRIRTVLKGVRFVTSKRVQGISPVFLHLPFFFFFLIG